ncbi:MAG TPA: hypothetical protein VMF69_02080 [Gemmataceae bacterium]|nr:hypothetical protein [Gemmataceae bacterium]
MATSAEWAAAYARQADADFKTFETLQSLPIPPCHQLQFLQMACEKLVKAHLCGEGTEPGTLQQSHAYIAKTLPKVLRQQALYVNFRGPKAKEALKRAAHLAKEIELLAPAVKRGGKRLDNCEYPWEDAKGRLHTPLDWTFQPSQLVVLPAGRTTLKLIRGAINRLLPSDI